MKSILAKYRSRETVGLIMSHMTTEIDIGYTKIRRDGSVIPAEFPQRTVSHLIRWGNIGNGPRAMVTYNNINAIKLASDKYQARATMLEYGIPTPLSWSKEELVTMTSLPFPIVIRKRKHFGGGDFDVVNNMHEFLERGMEDDEYGQELLPKEHEYRVHVGHGKILVMQEKEPEDPDALVWNHRYGAEFDAIKWKDYDQDVAQAAIKAVEVLGLDFGAVDVLAQDLDHDLPNVVVLEVNTSPRLDNYTAQRYAEYFKWLLNKDTRREHKEITGDLRTRFAFKHYELSDEERD